MLGFRSCASAMARMSCGTARNTSVTRMTTSPVQWPKYPASRPNGTPIKIDAATTISATVRAVLVPKVTRDRTSRPIRSVPNGDSADGGCRRRRMCDS